MVLVATNLVTLVIILAVTNLVNLVVVVLAVVLVMASNLNNNIESDNYLTLFLITK